MNSGEQKDVRSIMLDTNLVEQALHNAGVQAMIRHKRLGNPIVVWRDGQVVWIPAEEIEIPESLARDERASADSTASRSLE